MITHMDLSSIGRLLRVNRYLYDIAKHVLNAPGNTVIIAVHDLTPNALHNVLLVYYSMFKSWCTYKLKYTYHFSVHQHLNEHYLVTVDIKPDTVCMDDHTGIIYMLTVYQFENGRVDSPRLVLKRTLFDKPTCICFYKHCIMLFMSSYKVYLFTLRPYTYWIVKALYDLPRQGSVRPPTTKVVAAVGTSNTLYIKLNNDELWMFDTAWHFVGSTDACTAHLNLTKECQPIESIFLGHKTNGSVVRVTIHPNRSHNQLQIAPFNENPARLVSEYLQDRRSLVFLTYFNATIYSVPRHYTDNPYVIMKYADRMAIMFLNTDELVVIPLSNLQYTSEMTTVCNSE
jgi:hypothetical protein